MALLPPSIIGPLSECSSRIRVQGQLTGSTVDLFANGVGVGSGIASWSDQVFPLFAGIVLAAGSSVTATQTFAGQVSTQSQLAIQVQKRPPTIGYVGCQTHIYACGECLWLDGMVPGATVEVQVGGMVRGSGPADDGTARISLSPPTSPGEILVAQQTACGIVGPVTPLPAPDAAPRPLPSPTVVPPLKACQRAVTVRNVFDGAQVFLMQTAGPTEQACFDRSSLWFPTNPLVQGETVSAYQEFSRCELRSPNSNGVVVDPPTPVPPPMIVGPLCDGSTIVLLTNLLPGSKIRIIQNGIDLGIGEAPAPSFAFEVPMPLVGGSIVTAIQELCDIWSAPSNAVTVDPRPAVISAPVVPGPLYECGTAVRVTNLNRGSLVFVYSSLLGAPIGWQIAITAQADIPVAPQLIQGDQIHAVEIGCGSMIRSASVTVMPTAQPEPPQVQAPVEDCMRSVTVTNVIPGARVEVYVGNVWGGIATAGTITVEVPIFSGPLHIGDQIRARQRICQYVTDLGEPVEVQSHVPYYYLTQHFENARTGWNPYETTLTVANVPQLRQLFSQQVDAHVYAQPLYAHHVLIPDQGAHNVVYVATEMDTVYAFDADTKQPWLWQRSLLPTGETPLSLSDVENCDNIRPNIGITSTPVIDCATYTLYVVAKTKRVLGLQTTYHQYLYAIDMATGQDRPGSPQEIQASFPGDSEPNDGHGHVLFLPQWQLNRPGLLLHNGIVYVAFGAHCDFHIGEYHGWIAAYDATTFNQVATFCSSPDKVSPRVLICPPSGQAHDVSASGIWQSGMGLAADPEGFIYCTTGNGNFNVNMPTGRNYGDSVLKLRSNDLHEVSYFTPSNQATLLEPCDIDLGSGGVLVLPGQRPSLLITCGKDGNIFLLNRTNLGGYNGPNGPNNVVQSLPLQPNMPPGNQPGVWGGPAYYHGPGGEYIYYCGNGGHLTAFTLQNAMLTPSIIGGNPNQSPDPLPGGGGVTPTVSSNQQVAGTSVVWVLTRSNPLRLQAYDATNLPVRLRDLQAGSWNSGGAFIEPTVMQGKVYVGSDQQLTVFGL